MRREVLPHQPACAADAAAQIGGHHPCCHAGCQGSNPGTHQLGSMSVQAWPATPLTRSAAAASSARARWAGMVGLQAGGGQAHAGQEDGSWQAGVLRRVVGRAAPRSNDGISRHGGAAASPGARRRPVMHCRCPASRCCPVGLGGQLEGPIGGLCRAPTRRGQTDQARQQGVTGAPWVPRRAEGTLLSPRRLPGSMQARCTTRGGRCALRMSLPWGRPGGRRAVRCQIGPSDARDRGTARVRQCTMRPSASAAGATDEAGGTA